LHYLNSNITDAIKNLELIGNFDKLLPDKALYAFANLVNRLITWRFKNNKFKIYHPNNNKNLYVLGDSHSLSCNGLFVNINGQNLICKSSLILGIQMHHISSENSNNYKTSVIKNIQNIEENSFVLISIGEIDTRFNHGFLKNNIDNDEIEVSIINIVTKFINFFNNIRARKNKIIFMGIQLPNKKSLSDNEEINKIRLKIIEEINKLMKIILIEMRFGFLDIYGLTVNSELNPDFKCNLDTVHLTPEAYMVAFQNYLTLPVAK
jgi:hypothetical protein